MRTSKLFQLGGDLLDVRVELADGVVDGAKDRELAGAEADVDFGQVLVGDGPGGVASCLVEHVVLEDHKALPGVGGVGGVLQDEAAGAEAVLGGVVAHVVAVAQGGPAGGRDEHVAFELLELLGLGPDAGRDGGGAAAHLAPAQVVVPSHRMRSGAIVPIHKSAGHSQMTGSKSSWLKALGIDQRCSLADIP
jgi:hypothetical protein